MTSHQAFLLVNFLKLKCTTPMTTINMILAYGPKRPQNRQLKCDHTAFLRLTSIIALSIFSSILPLSPFRSSFWCISNDQMWLLSRRLAASNLSLAGASNVGVMYGRVKVLVVVTNVNFGDVDGVECVDCVIFLSFDIWRDDFFVLLASADRKMCVCVDVWNCGHPRGLKYTSNQTRHMQRTSSKHFGRTLISRNTINVHIVDSVHWSFIYLFFFFYISIGYLVLDFHFILVISLVSLQVSHQMSIVINGIWGDPSDFPNFEVI